MRSSSRFLSLVALTWLAFSSELANADSNASSPIVVRAADVSVTAADVSRRLDGLAGVQIEGLGGAPNSAPARVVDQVIVPELLDSLEAKARGLDKTPKYKDREREILRQALDADLKKQVLGEKPVTNDEVKGYFEANKARFEQPARLRIWRILVNDEATAKKLIEEAKAAGSPAKWSELARDNSIDKATSLRQGDLGFVHADGNTDTPRLRVDPLLFRAAAPLKDGEIAPQPVREGGKFAVVWRRGSLPEKSRTLEQEQDSIRMLLERQRVEEARVALLNDLTAKFVKDEHPELLEQLPDGMFGNRLARPRPFSPHRMPPGLRPPAPSADGLR